MADDLDCQDFVEMVTDHMENVLPAAQEQRIREHLAECDDCTEYLAQMGVVRSAIHGFDLSSLSTDARDRLNEIYHQWRSA